MLPTVTGSYYVSFVVASSCRLDAAVDGELAAADHRGAAPSDAARGYTDAKRDSSERLDENEAHSRSFTVSPQSGREQGCLKLSSLELLLDSIEERAGSVRANYCKVYRCH
jgi:hypothetical protein